MSEPVAYLLGEMDADQAARFEQAMAGNAALRAEVERLRSVVVRLERVPTEAWEAPEPPPLATPPGRAPRRLMLRPVVAVACALALLAAGVGVGTLLDREREPSEQVALAPVGDLDPSAQGRVSLDDDRVTVRVDGLRPTEAGGFYELWLLGPDQRLVGLGSFRVGDDGTATLRLPLPVDPRAFDFFDISLEPGDGDPGHSGASVLRGPTRS